MAQSATTNDLNAMFGDLIYSYTRAQAIEDGALIDVSELAAEAGFKFPVAITVAAWIDCVEWSHGGCSHGGCQDETGRLWDVLWMAGNAVRRSRSTDRITFSLLRVPNRRNCRRPVLTTLVAHCGPGDTGAPVITIMQDGES